MLKVIKSNVLFASVLLSIPAFACQTTAPAAQTAVKTGFFAKFAAGTGSLLSKARQAMPSLKPVNAKSCGRTAAAYLGSAAKGLLAFAKNHSKALAFTAGSLAIGALGWGWAIYRKVKTTSLKNCPSSQLPENSEDASDFHDLSAYEMNGYSGRLSDEPEF